MADNGLSDGDVIAVAKALKRNSVIRELDLGCNNVHNSGVYALADSSRRTRV